MVIMVKILLFIIFIALFIGLVFLGKYLFKAVDKMEVNETKKDIEHKSELTDDVRNYTTYNGSKMEKAKSDDVENFNNFDKK